MTNREEDVRRVIENNKYKLLSKYVRACDKIKVQCPKGHVYAVTYNNFRQGKRCPKCKQSNGERVFREVLCKILQEPFPTKRPKWLTNQKGNSLELDGYNEELGVAFEYQGIQHFQVVDYFKDTSQVLLQRQKHDEIKQRECIERGIILLSPTYKLKEDEFSDFIINALKNTQLEKFVNIEIDFS